MDRITQKAYQRQWILKWVEKKGVRAAITGVLSIFMREIVSKQRKERVAMQSLQIKSQEGYA